MESFLFTNARGEGIMKLLALNSAIMLYFHVAEAGDNDTLLSQMLVFFTVKKTNLLKSKTFYFTVLSLQSIMES